MDIYEVYYGDERIGTLLTDGPRRDRFLPEEAAKKYETFFIDPRWCKDMGWTYIPLYENMISDTMRMNPDAKVIAREPLIKSARTGSRSFCHRRKVSKDGNTDVFPLLETARLGQKIRCPAEADLFRGSPDLQTILCSSKSDAGSTAPNLPPQSFSQ